MKLFRRTRERRACFHHDNGTGESWIGRGSIIDWRKLYTCSNCGKVWVQ